MQGSGDFKEALLEASKIKTAQLKARPGRQAWEESPGWFRQTSVADAATKSIRKHSLDLRVAHAIQLKDQGNEAFKQDGMKALGLYVKAVGTFLWFDRGDKGESEDIPLVNSLTDPKATKGISEEHLRQAKEVVSACLSNAALCLLKADRFQDAVYACSKAVELDEWNVRALYRRAEAYYSQGTTADLGQCVSDLQTALKLEPGNAQIRSTLVRRQAELREQDRKDRQAFSGMFDAGSLYTETGEGCAALEGARKGPDPRSPEVQAAMRDIQKSVSAVKGRGPGGAGSAREMLARGEPSPLMRGLSSVLAPLAQVSRWGWMLIGLHLSYRLYKVFRVSEWFSLDPSLAADAGGLLGDKEL